MPIKSAILCAIVASVAAHVDLFAADGSGDKARTRPPDKPNVLIILADDLGYGDVRCYNPDRGKIPTPNIDRLASQGMRFTDAHSSSGVCSPSRYALLTGRYHWRTRLQVGIVEVFGEPLIPPDRLTIGGLAKRFGYRTAAIGKWHLGWNWPVSPEERKLLNAPRRADKNRGTNDEAPPDGPSPQRLAAWREIFSRPILGGPTTRGFESYFGTDVPNWPPYCFIENDRTIGIPNEFLPKKQLTPMLASLPGPALAEWNLESILPTLADRAAAFIQESAKKSEPFLLYLPLTAPHTPIAVTSEWRGKSGLNAYADFVMETDAAVGRVLDALQKSGAAERTLVLFTSDNGCASYTGAAELEKMGHYPSGPLRGYKADVWEGGHRIPFIVRWPGVVKPEAVCGRLVQQTDVMATLAEIFQTKLPDDAGEDSIGFLSLLRGEDRPVRESGVSCAYSGIPGFRQGEWKLILGPGSGNFDKSNNQASDAQQPIRLYDLANDLGETKNVAAEQPERVAKMRAAFEKIIVEGRSTPGTPRKNDVEVRRFAVKPSAKEPAKP